MSFSPLVSCVVPVYNAEKYLDQGMTSLLTQTYDSIEIILVDDRSTDNSWDICQRYAEEYPNVLAFQNKSNSGGPLRGRERGIRESHGDWITFMDCDDYVKPEYVENLVKATHDGKYDIAVTGHSRLYSDGRLEDFMWQDYSQTTAERLTTFYKHFLAHDFWTDPSDTAGQNLIRASICKKTDLSKYSGLVYAEDTLMALAFLVNSETGVNFVDKHDFVWRQVEGSGSHGGFSSRANQTEFYTACLDIFHDRRIYGEISQKLPLVSIIIPVYNVAQYLQECLESIITQTYKNIEIIIVNDGSTDGSRGTIETYAKSDHRIITLHQDNQGLNMARAAGSGIATGELIAFIDSDDIVHEDYIKIMYENMLTNSVDISICGYKKFETTLSDINEKITPNYAEQIIRNKSDVMRYYLGETSSASNVYQMSAWGKLYKAEIIKATDWVLSNYKRNEDNLEALQWYSFASKGIAIVSVPLYYYRLNPHSITATPQLCIDPAGKSLNYFEFIYVLYKRIKQYLNDDSYDLAVINQLAQTNSVQARNFLTNDWFDKDALNSAVDNWGELIKLYNQQVQLREHLIQQYERDLIILRSSFSWRVTKPLRAVKRLVLLLRKK